MYIDDIAADVYLHQSEPITSAGSLTGESVAIGTSPQFRSHTQNQMIISLSLLCISSTTNQFPCPESDEDLFLFSMVENEEGNQF